MGREPHRPHPVTREEQVLELVGDGRVEVAERTALGHGARGDVEELGAVRVGIAPVGHQIAQGEEAERPVARAGGPVPLVHPAREEEVDIVIRHLDPVRRRYGVVLGDGRVGAEEVDVRRVDAIADLGPQGIDLLLGDHAAVSRIVRHPDDELALGAVLDEPGIGRHLHVTGPALRVVDGHREGAPFILRPGRPGLGLIRPRRSGTRHAPDVLGDAALAALVRRRRLIRARLGGLGLVPRARPIPVQLEVQGLLRIQRADGRDAHPGAVEGEREGTLVGIERMDLHVARHRNGRGVGAGLGRRSPGAAAAAAVRVGGGAAAAAPVGAGQGLLEDVGVVAQILDEEGAVCAARDDERDRGEGHVTGEALASHLRQGPPSRQAFFILIPVACDRESPSI
ncbi:hypothetical protein D3C86_1297040 [compost metagenome]